MSPFLFFCRWVYVLVSLYGHWFVYCSHNDYDDEAQNYIFEQLLKLGDSRRTRFRWTEPNGGTFEGNCTIANISGPSRDAGAKGEISFEIHFNGTIDYTEPSAS